MPDQVAVQILIEGSRFSYGCPFGGISDQASLEKQSNPSTLPSQQLSLKLQKHGQPLPGFFSISIGWLTFMSQSKPKHHNCSMAQPPTVRESSFLQEQRPGNTQASFWWSTPNPCFSGFPTKEADSQGYLAVWIFLPLFSRDGLQRPFHKRSPGCSYNNFFFLFVLFLGKNQAVRKEGVLPILL